MPVSPVSTISKWKHLYVLELADPEFDTPAPVDILLGGDYYGKLLAHGQRLSPRGTPYAQTTCFGWTAITQGFANIGVLLPCRDGE